MKNKMFTKYKNIQDAHIVNSNIRTRNNVEDEKWGKQYEVNIGTEDRKRSGIHKKNQ